MLNAFERHLRTVAPHVRARLFPPRPPAAVAWSTALEDEDVGRVELTGELRAISDARELVVLVHGLGGTPDSLACRRGAAAFAARGVSTLSLALRGADRRGDDFYNIALTADLRAALASREVRAHKRVFVVGYSMGGYVALHLARTSDDARLCGVAAVCTPLDLAAAQRFIDSPGAALYRRRVLRGLIEIYSAVGARKSVPTDVARVRRVRTMHEWDRLTIAPRYGYTSPEHYYRELSIVPHLERLSVPALLVAASADPVIPRRTIEPFYRARHRARHRARVGRGHALQLEWVERAGHLAFSGDLDLGFGPELGLEAQLHQWFADRD